MQKHQEATTVVTIEDIADELHTVLTILQAIPSGCEQEFIALGKSAREGFSSSKALSDSMSTLLESITSEDENSVSEQVSALISLSKNSIEGIVETHEENKEFHDVLRKGMKRLSRECTSLEGASTYFNMLSTNIRITAAGIAKAGDMFNGVSDSTLTLSVDIHDAADKIGLIIADFLYEHEFLSDRIATESFSLKKIAGKILRGLTLASTEINTISQESRDEVSFLHQKVSHFSKMIGNIVVSVQFHDRMRQRLEHVHEAISDALQCVLHVDDSLSKIQLYFIIALQMEQLQNIENELRDLQNSVSNTFFELLRDVEKLQSRVINGSGGLDITRGLDSLQEVMVKQVTIKGEAEEKSQSVQASIIETVDKIKSIEQFLISIDDWVFQAQFVSLNASVNASKLGMEGGPLAVLSEEIVRQSEKLKLSVSKIKQILSELKEAIDAKEFAEKDDSAEIEELLDALKGSTSQFKAIQQGSISTELSALTQQLQMSKKESIFLEDLVHNISSAKAALISIQDLLLPHLDEEHYDLKNRNAVLEQIFNKYTMEEEREVHQKYFGTIGTSGSVSKADDDVELFEDDDVELFEDDDVELFDDDENAVSDEEISSDDPEENRVSENSKSLSDEEDLGDNVELF